MPDILIDTNVLMLLIIGSWDREQIQAHRRTETFTSSDFDLLQAELRRYHRVVTTPSVLTETSNLMENDFHETIAATLISVCTPFIEIIRPKEELLRAHAFGRLGFADMSVLAALSDEVVLLTDDVDLYLEALYEGFQATNFNHLRKFDG